MSTTFTTPGRHGKALLATVGAVLVAAVLVVLAGSPALAAISTVQDTDREHTQYGRWMFTQDPGVSGGWESTSRTPDATALLRFEGTRVAWKTLTYDGGGVTDVFLDGRKVASFDGYSGTQQNDVTGFSRRGLTKGKHTLKLVVTGTRGPSAPPGDVWSILDHFVVDGATVEEDSPRVSYDGWKTSASPRASGGTFRQGASETFGARCGLFSGSTQIDLITARGPTRGMATVQALDTFDNSVAAEVTVDLHARKAGGQHVVPVTGLNANKTYILEVVSADGTPVVFDGCVGNVVGRIN
ncbi:MAG: hypothetical protein AVDCRST_MAG05-2606 [uncultured Rubrobacteraceae bacterium]|uniref:Uncharacterized protein n=1 Tax=uncultured Rubrobacteraceae bacterium TaxID=349277 RepID=A0A6J4SS88_9ACTN|nr:MAG: hypothetical protein AVDCRST_MAG05-2606 [uncultured Rubrobacteraceae bacterium]